MLRGTDEGTYDIWHNLGLVHLRTLYSSRLDRGIVFSGLPDGVETMRSVDTV